MHFASLVLSVWLAAQQRPVFAHMDECGDPLKESMAWSLVTGKVEEVLDGATFRLRDTKGNVLRVTIPDVSPHVTAAALTVLKNEIEHKRVEIMAPMAYISKPDGHVSGQVHDDHDHDVAEGLLAAGLSPFVEAPMYTLSQYSQCIHRIAEREARQKHLGIWATQPAPK
jgi:endonuclease YncB( thermonuclease family)